MKSLQNIFRLFLVSIVIIAGGLFNRATAQQDPEYTQYMFNTLTVNSAYAGSKNAFNLILLSRNQWVGLEGAPQTQCMTIIVPVKKEKIAMGFSYVRDKIGPLTTDNIVLDFAYRLKLHHQGFLTMGVKAGIDNKKANLTTLDPVNKTDPTYSKDYMSKLSPNFGAGLYYYYANKFYLGLSTPKINTSDLSADASGNVGGADHQRRHYFIITGYVMDLSPTIKFKPAVYAKMVKGAPISVDLTAQFMFRDRFILGAAHRIGDSFGAMAEIRVFEKFWLGYAFDQTITKLRKYNSGTHEVLLSMDLELGRDGVIKSPRFF